jgi:hypothetical protein
MTKTRRNISLDDDADAALTRQIDAKGEASRYIAGLLAAADVDRAMGLGALRDAEWRPSEIAAALQLVEGVGIGLRCYVSPATVAGNMAMIGAGESYRRDWLGQLGIDEQTWADRCSAVGRDPELAAAVVLLARLWHADDAELTRAVAG